MPVDFCKKRIFLIVHGVQTGDDASLSQDAMIRDLMLRQNLGLESIFDTTLYAYEDIHDAAQQRIRGLLKLVQNTLVRRAIDLAFDGLGDVVISLRDGSTAHIIRSGLKKRILGIHAAGNPLFLVAHSLGTLYSFDVLNELVAEPGLFKPSDRSSWPVQALVTLGSPIGLKVFGRSRVTPLSAKAPLPLRWINYWDRSDPVVSGSIFGRTYERYNIVEQFHDRQTSGWSIEDTALSTGQLHLLAHTAYWKHPLIGKELNDLLTTYDGSPL